MESTLLAPVPFDSYPATCSGAPGTALDAAQLDFEGRRFLGSTTTDVATVPVRAYAGTAHGDATARAQALAAELVRLGAGDRRWLVLAAPTGRGWANHVLLRAIERLTGGDCAAACSQFGTARSTRSRGLMGAAMESFSTLLSSVVATPQLASRRIVVVGESFGAWTITRLLDELPRVGASGVLLAATPGVARLDDHALQLDALRDAGCRIVRHERPEDPVVAMPGANLMWRPSRRWRIADGRHWWPYLTLHRALRAIDTVTRFTEPWRLDLSSHDHRRVLPGLAAELLRMEGDPARVAEVSRHVLELEERDSTWRRSYGPEPRLSWPGVGN